MSRLVYIRPWPRSRRGGLTRYPRVNLVAQQAPAESGRGRADGTSDRPRPDLAGRGAVDRILVCMQGGPVLLEGLTLVGIAVEYLMKWEGITLSKSSNWLLFKWAVSVFRHCRTALWNTTDYHAGTILFRLDFHLGSGKNKMKWIRPSSESEKKKVFNSFLKLISVFAEWIYNGSSYKKCNCCNRKGHIVPAKFWPVKHQIRDMHCLTL